MPQRPSILRLLRWLAEFALAWPFLTLVRIMTPYWVDVVVHVGGPVAYYLLPVDRRWTHLNLRLAYRDRLSPLQRRDLAIAMFRHHIRTFLEILRITPRWIRKNVHIHAPSHLVSMVRDRPFIAVSGHLGNFDLFSAALNRIGIRNTMLVRPLDNPFFERLLASCRTRYGTTPASKHAPGLRDALRNLRNGVSIGIAIDQNTTENPVFVDFFGIPAASPQGAAAIALRTGHPVVLLATWRNPDHTHTIIAEGPFSLIQTGDESADIQANLQQYTRAFERYILAHPAQYHWQHSRFRTRPDHSTWKSTDRYEDLIASIARNT
jgi:KDO2-lipid IV(A) lauroyltransferase